MEADSAELARSRLLIIIPVLQALDPPQDPAGGAGAGAEGPDAAIAGGWSPGLLDAAGGAGDGEGGQGAGGRVSIGDEKTVCWAGIGCQVKQLECTESSVLFHNTGECRRPRR